MSRGWASIRFPGASCGKWCPSSPWAACRCFGLRPIWMKPSAAPTCLCSIRGALCIRGRPPGLRAVWRSASFPSCRRPAKRGQCWPAGSRSRISAMRLFRATVSAWCSAIRTTARFPAKVLNCIPSSRVLRTPTSTPWAAWISGLPRFCLCAAGVGRKSRGREGETFLEKGYPLPSPGPPPFPFPRFSHAGGRRGPFRKAGPPLGLPLDRQGQAALMRKRVPS